METYDIEGLACASCAASAQKILGRTKGVEDVRVNYATKTAAISLGTEVVGLEALNERLSKLGFKLHPKTKDAYLERQQRSAKSLLLLKRQLIVGAVFAFPLFVIAMFFPTMAFANYSMFALTLPILGWSGRRFFVSAFQQITIGKVNMDSLVALGTGTAFVFSTFNTFFPAVLEARGMVPHVYFEAVGVLLVFVLLGKYLEARAGQQTSSAIEELLAMQASTVQLIEDGQEKTLPVEVVQVGDILKIRPGDTIPLDGILLEGTAQLDESMLTGEAMPVDKSSGMNVFSGTLVQQGSFQLQVTKIGGDTVLSQIIKLVESAQNSQVPVQKLVDRIAAVFVPIVMLIALLTLAVWLAYGLPVEGVVAAVAVLVVACPCALGLATPTAIMVGIGEAAKKGILIRNAEAIEHAATIDTIVLDKTGTITEGLPELQEVAWEADLGTTKENLEAILVALENESEHPIAQQLVEHYKRKGVETTLDVSNFSNHSGLGLSATVLGASYWVGNERLIQQEQLVISKKMKEQADQFHQAAKTLAFFANEREVLAVLAFSDTIKEHSAQAIKNLKTSGKTIYMLTGDHEGTASQVAQEVGIDHFEANLMPQDKIAFIQRLQEKGKKVMMVGDGINDAPALAQANVGIAMNKGTSVAISSADIVLRNNDLTQLMTIVETSTKMLTIIRQNLFWAFIYNIILIPVAAGIFYPFGLLLNPMIAGGAMALSSVFVVMNSLRLKQMN